MDLQTALDLIRLDVMATIVDARARDVVLYLADERRGVIEEHGWSEADDRLVEDVQQIIHDMHIDTTWPQCPVHPHHPLWFSDGHWRCDKGSAVAIPLGGL